MSVGHPLELDAYRHLVDVDPSVVRWPTERIASARPNGRLIRINTQHPEVPEELTGRPISTDAPT